MKKIEMERNYTIDFIRVIMAIFIVALHSTPFVEYNDYFSYFVSQVLARIGVPFFAMIAGYYCFRSYSQAKCGRLIMRYLEIYTVWSVIYTAYLIVMPIIRGGVCGKI